MTFQSHIDNSKAKTGLSLADFKKRAEAKGFIAGGKLKPDVKAAEIVHWLKQDVGLGHGHAMAIYATFKGRKG